MITERDIPVSNSFQKAGFTIWFTGLSASGKSSLAVSLQKAFLVRGLPSVLLDGDEVRKNIHSDLGFSLSDREENNRRAAEIAKVINNSGIIVIASFISPTEKIREGIRKIIGDEKFILVYLNTPIEICEKRDAKQLYQKAKAGIIKDFSGISSEFEVPSHPHLLIDGLKSVNENTELFLSYLKSIKDSLF